MKRVIGIGGIFFKAQDPEKLAACHRKFGRILGSEGNKIELWEPL